MEFSPRSWEEIWVKKPESDFVSKLMEGVSGAERPQNGPKTCLEHVLII